MSSARRASGRGRSRLPPDGRRARRAADARSTRTPPRDRQSKSSTSLQPYRPERRARRSAPARRWNRRRRAAPASRGGSRWWCTRPSCSRPGRGCRGRPSADSSAASDVRAGSRIVMSPGRHSRSSCVSWSVTSQRSCSAVATASAASAASRQRRSSAFARCSPRSACSPTPIRLHRAVLEMVRTAGGERLVCRLRVGLGLDQPPEHVVDPLDHRRRRAEVGAQRGAVGTDLIGGAQVLGDVGAPEPVDRLLRVADDEQPAGKRRELGPVGVPGRGRRERPPAEPRSRAGSDRCPGTRRAAGAGSDGGARRGSRAGSTPAGGPAPAGRGTRPCRRPPAPRPSRAPSARGSRRPGVPGGCGPTRAGARPRRGSRARDARSSSSAASPP